MSVTWCNTMHQLFSTTALKLQQYEYSNNEIPKNVMIFSWLPQFVEPCLYARFIRCQKPVLPCTDMHRLGGVKLQTGSLSMSSSVPNISNQTPHSVISYIRENTYGTWIHPWTVFFVVPSAMPYNWSSVAFKNSVLSALSITAFPPYLFHPSQSCTGVT